MGSRKKSIQMQLIEFARDANESELDAAIDILRSFKNKPARKAAKKQAEKVKAASGTSGGTTDAQIT